MKTNFQQFNSKSDEELIELSMGNSVDASMAHNVLEYRKYLEAKLQNQLSFRIAKIMAWVALIQLGIAFFQVTIAFFDFRNSNTVIHVASATESSTPIPSATSTKTSKPIPSPTQQPTPSSSLPNEGTEILQSYVTVVTTDDNEVELLISKTAGTAGAELSKGTKLGMCNSLIAARNKTVYSSIEFTESIPWAMIGWAC